MSLMASAKAVERSLFQPQSYLTIMRAVSAIVLGLVFIICSQFYILSRAIDSSEGRRALRTVENANEVSVLQTRVAELLIVIQTRDKRIDALQQELIEYKTSENKDESLSDAVHGANVTAATKSTFPDTMSSFMHGVSRVQKEEFLQTFDYGLPEVTDVEREVGQSEVLLLYNTESALPVSTSNNGNDGLAGPLLNVKEATAKCETLNVVSIGDPNEASGLFMGSQCLALVGHEQMYHVQRFVKNADNNDFELVQRETIKQSKTNEYTGQYSFESEENESSPARLHRKFLAKYLLYIDTLKVLLKPLLESIAIDNTVIVMVCNKDQSSLLHNFACACRAKGIHTNNVVVFPTDLETESLAKSLGYATFFDKEVRFRVRIKAFDSCLSTSFFSYSLIGRSLEERRMPCTRRLYYER